MKTITKLSILLIFAAFVNSCSRLSVDPDDSNSTITKGSMTASLDGKS